MEHWPSYARSTGPAVTKQNGRRITLDQQTWTNFPVLDHGALSAGALLKARGGHFEWKSTVSQRQGSLDLFSDQACSDCGALGNLISVASPVRCYPSTKTLAKPAKKETLHKTSETGVSQALLVSKGFLKLPQIQFLRAAYPDIDVPFAVVKEQLSEVGTLQKQLAIFDALQGCRLSASYMTVGSDRSLVALSYPSGPLRNQLGQCFQHITSDEDLIIIVVVSPVIMKHGRAVFQPQARPVWTTETPICQITSSTESVDLSDAKSDIVF